MSILEVKNLKKNFGSLEVLKGIDFSLEKGEALAMIGASGSGKTTLLRCLNFLERPTHGQIIVNDKVIFDADDNKSLGDAQIRKNRYILEWYFSPLIFSHNIQRYATVH